MGMRRFCSRLQLLQGFLEHLVFLLGDPVDGPPAGAGAEQQRANEDTPRRPHEQQQEKLGGLSR